ncbi:hypothetical protein ST37_10830 [Vibrio sp. qd031]|uniref:integrase domain-containing protein n=1 Tax=Vibrio sp. qd031 TaxID=1603038 RepID=UPI000A114B07|nr:integrase domain-containing protein [Vibrio sp. qd031]ORT50358.1 hypothetical protein ST37_10830 [Vibrio sp. qd031]
MKKKSSKKNFGFGRSFKFATKAVLKHKFGEGRYQTRQAHLCRSKLFFQFIYELGIDDFRFIEQDDIEAYASWVASIVQSKRYSLSYGTNLLSSMNVILECLREDRELEISPSKYLGKRSHRRTKPLIYLPMEQVEARYIELRKQEQETAFTFAASRLLGLRLRETVLLRPKEALKQHRSEGKINVTRGTKGGRKTSRWVATSPFVEQVLEDALGNSKSKGSRNMIPSDQSMIKVYRHIEYKLRAYLKSEGFGTIHDLRAMFACDRMNTLIGYQVPIRGGGKIRDKAEYYEHAKTVAKELGHNREYVINSYCG